jgi:hypothetical protein
MEEDGQKVECIIQRPNSPMVFLEEPADKKSLGYDRQYIGDADLSRENVIIARVLQSQTTMMFDVGTSRLKFVEAQIDPSLRIGLMKKSLFLEEFQESWTVMKIIGDSVFGYVRNVKLYAGRGLQKSTYGQFAILRDENLSVPIILGTDWLDGNSARIGYSPSRVIFSSSRPQELSAPIHDEIQTYFHTEIYGSVT